MSSPRTLASGLYEISFSLTEKDAWTLFEALNRASPGTPGRPASQWARTMFRALIWFIKNLFLVLLIVSLVGMAFAEQPIRKWQVVLVAFIGVIFGVSTGFTVPQREMPPLIRTFIGLHFQRTIVLADDGFHSSMEGGTSFVPWGAYSRVELANGFVLMYRGEVADFIPVSAFSSAENADEATRFIAVHIKEAHRHA